MMNFEGRRGIIRRNIEESDERIYLSYLTYGPIVDNIVEVLLLWDSDYFVTPYEQVVERIDQCQIFKSD